MASSCLRKACAAHINVTMSRHNTPNLVGALAVAVIDAIEDVTRSLTGHAGETAAALVAIGHEPGLTNDGLRQVLGLSHPGAVRVVDRLIEAGLVERREGMDRRAIALHMTQAGYDARTALLDRRQDALEQFLTPLDANERASLGKLLAKVLEQRPTGALHGLSICRLCDNNRCQSCPIEAGVARVAPDDCERADETAPCKRR